MSEAAAPAEAPKKKKLPLIPIIAVVLLLAGGGFFMMKGKGDKKDKKEITIEIGETEFELKDEFLVNMIDQGTYLRCKIALKMKKGVTEHDVEAHHGEITDAINLTLKATNPKETSTLEDMKKLKRRIAAAINEVMPAAHGEEAAKDKEPEHAKEEKPKKTHEVKIKTGHDEPAAEEKKSDKPAIPEDWDSLEGPCLKVLFISFATQG